MRNELYGCKLKSARYGAETISFLSPKVWALITQNEKNSSSLTCYKKIDML